ncbi:hypothetical protein BDV12DRAFT_176557 [Aspergillus spectabilis]
MHRVHDTGRLRRRLYGRSGAVRVRVDVAGAIVASLGWGMAGRLAREDTACRVAALATGATTSAAATGSVASIPCVCEPGHATLGVFEHDAAIVFDGRGVVTIRGSVRVNVVSRWPAWVYTGGGHGGVVCRRHRRLCSTQSVAFINQSLHTLMVSGSPGNLILLSVVWRVETDQDSRRSESVKG